MKRRRVLLLVAVVALLAGVFLAWPRGPNDPVYQGKPTRDWLEVRRWSKNKSEQENALQALRATSPQSRRYWLAEFQREYSPWSRRVNRFLVVELGIGSTIEDDQKRFSTAAYALYLLGPEVVPVLPEIARYIGDEERDVWTIFAMAGAGDAAVPFLLNATNSANVLVAEAAREGIKNIAGETEAVLPTLFAWLEHPDPAIRLRGVLGLENSAFQTNRIVNALIPLLSDTNARVVSAAAVALGRKRGAAMPAIPHLLPLTTNSARGVAKASSNALFRIDSNALPKAAP